MGALSNILYYQWMLLGARRTYHSSPTPCSPSPTLPKSFILVCLSLLVCYLQTLEKIHLYCDMNQAQHSFEPCVLTTRLTHTTQRVRHQVQVSHILWFFPSKSISHLLFWYPTPALPDSKPSISNDRCTSIKGFNMYQVSHKSLS